VLFHETGTVDLFALAAEAKHPVKAGWTAVRNVVRTSASVSPVT